MSSPSVVGPDSCSGIFRTPGVVDGTSETRTRVEKWNEVMNQHLKSGPDLVDKQVTLQSDQNKLLLIKLRIDWRYTAQIFSQSSQTRHFGLFPKQRTRIAPVDQALVTFCECLDEKSVEVIIKELNSLKSKIEEAFIAYRRDEKIEIKSNPKYECLNVSYQKTLNSLTMLGVDVSNDHDREEVLAALVSTV